ncbi:MAG TPA: uroporphyrinogen-III C-methyltransferase [Burkholderiaceae bacterium]|nr:uroporphyrinogen-III C-methyltransferase [Burkholderiaceae bacterium]
MTDLPSPSAGPHDDGAPATALALPSTPASTSRSRANWIALAVLVLLCVLAVVMAVNTQQRMRSLERDLVKRQQESQGESAEARVLAKQAQDAAREASAKVALLDARVNETTLQRSQLEELIQSLSRSRDENLLTDIQAAIRVAQQQSALTGSAEPLVATLKQADERLARANQPRLERVRRAIARDLDRIKAVGIVDLSMLAIRLDEAIRMVDELPLLAAAEVPRRAQSSTDVARGPSAHSAHSASAPASASGHAAWATRLDDLWRAAGNRVWEEVRALVRVTRIDSPEAALLAPEQGFFVRENVKLRLLNARLAILSRQFDTAQSDLRDVQAAIDRYFDRTSRRVAVVTDLVKQVAAQAHLVNVPRPDDTLAALSALAAGR